MPLRGFERDAHRAWPIDQPDVRPEWTFPRDRTHGGWSPQRRGGLVRKPIQGRRATTSCLSAIVLNDHRRRDLERWRERGLHARPASRYDSNDVDARRPELSTNTAGTWLLRPGLRARVQPGNVNQVSPSTGSPFRNAPTADVPHVVLVTWLPPGGTTCQESHSRRIEFPAPSQRRHTRASFAMNQVSVRAGSNADNAPHRDRLS